MADIDEKWKFPFTQFCERNDMSTTTGRKAVREGWGPRITRIGAKTFVTVEAEREWRKMMENPVGKAAEIAAYHAKMLHEKAKHAYSQREDQRS